MIPETRRANGPLMAFNRPIFPIQIAAMLLISLECGFDFESGPFDHSGTSPSAIMRPVEDQGKEVPETRHETKKKFTPEEWEMLLKSVDRVMCMTRTGGTIREQIEKCQ